MHQTVMPMITGLSELIARAIAKIETVIPTGPNPVNSAYHLKGFTTGERYQLGRTSSMPPASRVNRCPYFC